MTIDTGQLSPKTMVEGDRGGPLGDHEGSTDMASQVRTQRSASEPLHVHFDASSYGTLRAVMIEKPSLFIECDSSNADVVIFGSDDIGYIRKSVLYNQYKLKSICITESDIPTFYLPGLYAANESSYLTRSRTKTISYFISERDRPNPAVRRFSGQHVEKQYLYSFMGRSNSWARKRLLRHVQPKSDTLIEATNSYAHWTDDQDNPEQRENQRLRYARVMAASKFALCPRGCGLSSYRLFESLSLGVAPVIIADQWQPIEGIDWSFAIFLPERRIPLTDQIVRSHENEWEERGRLALLAYKTLLEGELTPKMLHHKIVELVPTYDPTREAIMAPLARLRSARRKVYWSAYKWLKYLVLRGAYLSGRSLPIWLAEPLEQQLNRRKP